MQKDYVQYADMWCQSLILCLRPLLMQDPKPVNFDDADSALETLANTLLSLRQHRQVG